MVSVGFLSVTMACAEFSRNVPRWLCGGRDRHGRSAGRDWWLGARARGMVGMTGEKVIIELVSIVEQTCYPNFDRDYGTQEPVTAEQWDILSDKLMQFCAKNKPRTP